MNDCSLKSRLAIVFYMKKNLNNIVFFASSPGGHFSQLLSLHELFDKHRSVIVTSNQFADFSIPELQNVYSIEKITNFRDKAKKKTNKSRLRKIPTYFRTYRECFRVWKKYRPKVIVSTGSNIAIPFCLISKVFGSKFVFIETRAKVFTKTATGKAIGKLADLVIVQWPEMVEVYGGKALYLGTLV